ncbi:MAG TPA: sorbosone dehydrogenase family protein [Salinimicrobium sp.]|nr:sorbosone dehydrogenase family protein [Salinimicrobium sp.]
MLSCNENDRKKKIVQVGEEEVETVQNPSDTVKTTAGTVILPEPYSTESVAKSSKVIGWPEGKKPVAPDGFTVTKFADNFQNPRWTYIAPNNDIFVVESNTRNSANQITILRDGDGDNLPELRNVFLDSLNQPFGMLILDNYFYVANTDGLYRYPYTEGITRIEAEGEKIVDLPAGGYNHHWTRNIVANEDGSKIYISVGSTSNVGEYGLQEEKRRAAILEINPDGTGEKIYASGLRNPVGMDWNPVTGDLWTAVNERDKLGDGLVPDYVTKVVEGGFYGWPFSYFGKIIDPRWEDDPHLEMVEKSIVPDVSVGAHTASLGFTFYTADLFPEKYKNGAFVGQHGSWNRSEFSGYKVVFIPFENGIPQQPQDFLSGFIADEATSEVYGRPVCVAVLPDGSLLVNDDSGNTLWRVSVE